MTPLQTEVYNLHRQGLGTRDIAREMAMSKSSVSGIKSRIGIAYIKSGDTKRDAKAKGIERRRKRVLSAMSPGRAYTASDLATAAGLGLWVTGSALRFLRGAGKVELIKAPNGAHPAIWARTV